MTSTIDRTDIVQDVLRLPDRSRKTIDERLRAFDQIPFVTQELRRSHIQLLQDDPEPGRVNPRLVGKRTTDNCLLSEPFRCGEVVYFNLFTDSGEIELDHQSDHVVGLVTIEAVRQIGMALSHELADLPLNTRMALQEFTLRFYNYIEPDFPIVARAVGTLSFDRDLGHDHTAFLDVRQNGVTCLAGISSSRLCAVEERYQRIRGKVRSMNALHAGEFAGYIGGMDAPGAVVAGRQTRTGQGRRSEAGGSTV